MSAYLSLIGRSRGWALINFFCLWDGRLFKVGANSRLGAYSNKYGILICDSSLEPVLVVVRLAQNGCLLDYLRKSRENLYINVEKSKINFELSDRVGIARDIANGMLHLSNKKVRCISKMFHWDNEFMKDYSIRQ